jgi:hypothetical protein
LVVSNFPPQQHHPHIFSKHQTLHFLFFATSITSSLKSLNRKNNNNNNKTTLKVLIYFPHQNRIAFCNILRLRRLSFKSTRTVFLSVAICSDP